MRIIVDLQSNQSTSHKRGIGQYAIAFTKKMIEQGKKHDFFILLNGSLSDTILTIRSLFRGIIPAKNIRIWYPLTPIDYAHSKNTWRRQTAELTREAVLSHLAPDIVLIMSLFEGLHEDVATSIGNLETAAPTAMILYDLIPFLYPERYLKNSAAKAWYHEKLEHLKRADLFFAISESSRQEALTHLSLPAAKVVNISAAVNTTVFQPSSIDEKNKQLFQSKYSLSKPFILCVTGNDPRKNTSKLIQAYALLSSSLRLQYPLAIVSSTFSKSDRQMLTASASAAGLEPEECLFYTNVPLDDLCYFYHLCKLFIFPSYHEGFGLPLLEAMSCGKAVLGADCSSIPEVIGCSEALFNPHDEQAIRNKLAQALTDEAFLEYLEKHALQQSAEFSWDKTAAKALTVLEDWHQVQQHAIRAPNNLSARPSSSFNLVPEKTDAHLLTLALVYCFDPTTNLAGNDYLCFLLERLHHTYSIELITSFVPNLPWLEKITPYCTVRDIKAFKTKEKHFYDRILYWVMDAPISFSLYELMEEKHGILFLHDFFLPQLFQSLPQPTFMQTLYQSFGYFSLIQANAHAHQNINRSFKHYPCPIKYLQNAIQVFIPEENFKTQAAEYYPTKDVHAWETLARTDTPAHFANAIEKCYDHPYDTYSTLLPQLTEAITSLPTSRWHRPAIKRALPQLAQTIADSFHPPFSQPQLLLDISILVKHDSKTGIQRVVRAILWELLHNPPEGYRVEPIFSQGNLADYRYARQFTLAFLGQPAIDIQDDPIESQSGDQFFSIDLAQHVTIANRAYYQWLRQRGIQVNFIVYDLLPIELPHVFPPEVESLHRKWLSVVSENDGALCISHVVAQSLEKWRNQNSPLSHQAFKISWFHLGADFKNAHPSRGIPLDAAQHLARLQQGPSFLMVGTIEPRKGYEQAFAAFEKLWLEDNTISLVIIGKQGWLMQPFTERLRHHPERGKRLFWFEGISDEYMEQIYSVCTCLLANSLGEGFGLPLIEAAQHNLPILARDITIFREVAKEFAYYFQGDTPESLALAIHDWISQHEKGLTPSSAHLPWLTWKQSVSSIIERLLNTSK